MTVECELVDSLMRPVAEPPVLSVVIPTFFRPKEMTEAVVSIASQVDAALQGKVEIIVTDNASGPETQAALAQLADAYPFFNYMIHARDMGGPVQIFGAPFRARGRWTWVFGDDDALAEGGLAAVVEVLEREAPAFLTINRQVWNPSFTTELSASKHDLPDLRFDTFLDLLTLFGFDQLSFLTSQVYATDLARKVDLSPYLPSLCRFVQLAYYIEAFHDRPAYYLSHPFVRHRWDPDARATHAANFLDLATSLPELVQGAAEKIGLEPGLFERVGGRRQLVGPETRAITFVDNILENLWRCVAIGTPVAETDWDMLERLSEEWRSEHAEQLKTVRQIHGSVANAMQHHEALVSEHRARVAAAPESPAELDMLDRIAAAVKSLEGEINGARKTAFDIAGQFS